MRLVVEPMELEDIPQVLEVDRESYSLPWPASAYRREIVHNRNARYIVLRRIPDEGEEPVPALEPGHRPRLPIPFFRWPQKAGETVERPGHIVGYAGMWLMVDEAHITTIAVRADWRGRGLGELLLASLIEEATALRAHRVTLEVRVSNDTAQRLYRKYGFHQEGVRARYYSDNSEDAYIMTTNSLQSSAYQTSFTSLVTSLQERLLANGDVSVAAPAFSALQDAGAASEAD